MYDGTITIADPDLVTTLDDMPEGYHAYVLHDRDAESPREADCNVAILAQTSSRYLQPDQGYGPAEADALTGAWERWRDHDLTERFARIYLDAVAYGSWDDPRSESRVLGIVTRAGLADAGYTQDRPGPLSGTLQMRAQAILDAELDAYRQYCEGEVYGVIVVRESDGEQASLWSCYDDSGDYAYLREVATELLDELQ